MSTPLHQQNGTPSPRKVREQCYNKACQALQGCQRAPDPLEFASKLSKFVFETASSVQDGLDIVRLGMGVTPEDVIASGVRLKTFYDAGIIIPSSDQE